MDLVVSLTSFVNNIEGVFSFSSVGMGLLKRVGIDSVLNEDWFVAIGDLVVIIGTMLVVEIISSSVVSFLEVDPVFIFEAKVVDSANVDGCVIVVASVVVGENIVGVGNEGSSIIFKDSVVKLGAEVVVN